MVVWLTVLFVCRAVGKGVFWGGYGSRQLLDVVVGVDGPKM